jgi:large subunit ribosomal protein L28
MFIPFIIPKTNDLTTKEKTSSIYLLYKLRLFMSQRCDITGKGKQYGHNVSASLRRTQKIWKPNLQKKTFVIDGRKVTMKISANAIRTLKKKAILK